MGFLDRLGDAAKGFVKGLADVVEAPVGLVVDLAKMPFDDKSDDFGSVINSITNRGAQMIGGAFGPKTGLGAVAGVMPEALRKPVRTVFHGMDWAYNEIVSQPVSTFFTALQLAGSPSQGGGTGGTYIDKLFDSHTWSDAYHRAEHISPGQALGNTILGFEDIDPFDPRNADTIEAVKQTGAYKVFTGTLDAVFRLGADPTNLALEKVNTVRRGYLGIDVVKGGQSAIRTALASERTTNFINRVGEMAASYGDDISREERVARLAGDIRNQVYHNHSQGAVISSVIANTYDNPDKLRTALGAMLGDTEALTALEETDKLLAGQIHNATSTLNSLDDTIAEARLIEASEKVRLPGAAEAEVKSPSLFDIVDETPDELLPVADTISDEAHNLPALLERRKAMTLEFEGLMEQQRVQDLMNTARLQLKNAPRFTVGSSVREWGTHSFIYKHGPVGPVIRFMTERAPARVLQLENAASDVQLWDFLRHGGVSEAEATVLRGKYVQALDATARQGVAAEAESAVVRAIAEKHGLDPMLVDKVVEQARASRGATQRTLQKAMRFDGENRDLVFVGDDAVHVVSYPMLQTQTGNFYHLPELDDIEDAAKFASKVFGKNNPLKEQSAKLLDLRSASARAENTLNAMRHDSAMLALGATGTEAESLIMRGRKVDEQIASLERTWVIGEYNSLGGKTNAALRNRRARRQIAAYEQALASRQQVADRIATLTPNEVAAASPKVDQMLQAESDARKALKAAEKEHEAAAEEFSKMAGDEWETANKGVSKAKRDYIKHHIDNQPTAGALVTEVLDKFNSVWKPLQLLRVGWPVRVISDEVMRSAASIGAIATMANVGKGLFGFGGIADRTASSIFRHLPGDTLDSLFSREAVDRRWNRMYTGVDVVEAGGKKYAMTRAWGAGDEGLRIPQDEALATAASEARSAADTATENATKAAEAAKAHYEPNKAAIDAHQTYLDAVAKHGAPDVAAAREELQRAEAAANLGGREDLVQQVFDKHDAEMKTFSEALDEVRAANGFTEPLTTSGKDIAAARQKLDEVRQAAAHESTTGGRSVLHDEHVRLTREAERTSAEAAQKGVAADRAETATRLQQPDAVNPAIFKNATNARESWDAMLSAEADRQYRALNKRSGLWQVRNPTDEGHMDAWVHIINKQYHNDPLIKRIAGGASRDEVYAWLTSNPEGMAYAAQLPYRRSRMAEWVDNVFDQFDSYTGGQHGEIVDMVLNGNATVSKLTKVFPHLEDRPIVHGDGVAQMLSKPGIKEVLHEQIGKAYEVLGSTPTNVLSRHPYFASVYKTERDSLVHLLAGGKEALTDADLNLIEKVARQRALAAVKKTMFDMAETYRAQEALRFLMPFFGAQREMMTRWAGLTAEHPGRVANIFHGLSMAPYSAGLVVDENGQQVEHYWQDTHNPDGTRTKERFIQFTMPDVIADHIPGMRATVIDKDGTRHTVNGKFSFNTKQFTILSTSLGLGPIVQVPLGTVLQHRPDLEEQFSALMPFGAPKNVLESMLPAWGQRAYSALNEDEVFVNTAMATWASMQANWMANGSPEDQKPTWEQAMAASKTIYAIRQASAFSFFGAQVKSPYQPLIDMLRMYKAQDEQDRKKAEEQGIDLRNQDGYQSPEEKFLAQEGDWVIPLTISMSRSLDGVAPTQEAWSARAKYKDLVEQFPELGGLIIGTEGAGDFSQSIYNAQKAQSISATDTRHMREQKTPEEFMAEPNIRLGWTEYRNLSDAITLELERRDGARKDGEKHGINYKENGDLLAWKQENVSKLADAYPEWWAEFTKTDRDKDRRTVEGLRTILDDPRFAKMLEDPSTTPRPDLLLAREWLGGYDAVQTVLAQRKLNGGSSVLSSAENADLAAWWEAQQQTLVRSSLSFSSLWYRYLERIDPSPTASGPAGSTVSTVMERSASNG